MPIAKNRKTYIISHFCVLGDQSVTIDFSSLLFQPDEMIVRSLHLRDSSGGSLLIGAIKCDFLLDPICAFATNDTLNTLINTNYENTFIVSHINIHGLHTFSIIDPTNSGGQFVGLFAISVEFIQYTKYK